MKQTVFGRVKLLLCVLLSLFMVFSLTACDGEDAGGGSGALKLSTTSGTVDVGASSLTLMASGNGSDAVVWTSSDETVATVALVSTAVTTAARVTGVSVGTATITATAGEKIAMCTVTVTAPETISITKDGSAAPEEIKLTKGGTAQLTATSTKGHNISWTSDSDLIATVSETGLVTAVASSGTATITAKCGGTDNTTGAISASVTVTIGSGVNSSYDIEWGGENGAFDDTKDKNSNEDPGHWRYWDQWNNVASAVYSEGVVTVELQGIEEGAIWYIVQLFYTALPTDTDTDGNSLVGGQHYKVTFDIDVFMACGITVNSYPLQLNEGVNHCTIYYDHYATAFSLQFGVEGKGCDIKGGGAVKLSNIVWEKSSKVTLATPAYSVAGNVITITDSNPAGSVGSYSLTLYNGSNAVGSVAVTNGQTIDTSKIQSNGTFTSKLVALPANAHYIASSAATSASGNVTVNNAGISYNLASTGSGGAVKEPGVWTYWTEWWVVFTGSCNNGTVTVDFSNNSGNWYDTQLFYKSVGKAVGDTYTLKLHIATPAGAGGRITVNDVVYTLDKGTETVITLNITETAGHSVQILFGVNGENNRQEIQSASGLTIQLEEV